jgi:hypothetical protein
VAAGKGGALLVLRARGGGHRVAELAPRRGGAPILLVAGRQIEQRPQRGIQLQAGRELLAGRRHLSFIEQLAPVAKQRLGDGGVALRLLRARQFRYQQQTDEE